MAGLLFFVESQASDVADRSTLQAFLSKYMPYRTHGRIAVLRGVTGKRCGGPLHTPSLSVEVYALPYSWQDCCSSWSHRQAMWRTAPHSKPFCRSICLTVLMAGLLFFVESQASDVADRSTL